MTMYLRQALTKNTAARPNTINRHVVEFAGSSRIAGSLSNCIRECLNKWSYRYSHLAIDSPQHMLTLLGGFQDFATLGSKPSKSKNETFASMSTSGFKQASKSAQTSASPEGARHLGKQPLVLGINGFPFPGKGNFAISLP